MPDPAQLPHLLRLIDDESEPVRQAVAKALAEFGSSLAGELAQLAKLPDEAQMRMIYELLESLGDDFVTASEKVEVETEPRFEVGQLVKHRRYGYRGVIVSRDLTYGAEDDWYLANQTQPDRDQPWYHVLVHDSEQVTHAAQTSLQGDDSDQQVVHPMIDHFFSAFSDGQYIRNDEAWPPS